MKYPEVYASLAEYVATKRQLISELTEATRDMARFKLSLKLDDPGVTADYNQCLTAVREIRDGLEEQANVVPWMLRNMEELRQEIRELQDSKAAAEAKKRFISPGIEQLAEDFVQTNLLELEPSSHMRRDNDDFVISIQAVAIGRSWTAFAKTNAQTVSNHDLFNFFRRRKLLRGAGSKPTRLPGAGKDKEFSRDIQISATAENIPSGILQLIRNCNSYAVNALALKSQYYSPTR